jgi:hypothetical protein
VWCHFGYWLCISATYIGVVWVVKPGYHLATLQTMGQGDGMETKELTPNQVVAHNLRRARELRRWTQEQAAEALEHFIGSRWSKWSYSVAERAAPERIRQFTADDVVAFALAFELPIAWFFLPPPEAVVLRHGGSERSMLAGANLLDLLFNLEGGEIQRRLAEHYYEAPSDERSEHERRVMDMARQRHDALLRDAVRDWQEHKEAFRKWLALLDEAEAAIAGEGSEDFASPSQTKTEPMAPARSVVKREPAAKAKRSTKRKSTTKRKGRA